MPIGVPYNYVNPYVCFGLSLFRFETTHGSVQGLFLILCLGNISGNFQETYMVSGILRKPYAASALPHTIFYYFSDLFFLYF